IEGAVVMGARVVARQSFPRILEPIASPARMSDSRIAGEPRELGGIRLTFDGGSREVAATLKALLDRVHAPAPRAAGDDRPCRVLLVDDSPLVRDIFAYGTSQFFDRPGLLAVDHAEDAAQAWAKLAGSSYDLVIVDYLLP